MSSLARKVTRKSYDAENLPPNEDEIDVNVPDAHLAATVDRKRKILLAGLKYIASIFKN